MLRARAAGRIGGQSGAGRSARDDEACLQARLARGCGVRRPGLLAGLAGALLAVGGAEPRPRSASTTSRSAPRQLARRALPRARAARCRTGCTQISYDQWRDIRFRPDRALWRDQKLPFQVQFFHPGLFYDRTVRDERRRRQGRARRSPSRPSHFDYGKNDFASHVPQDLGYAGFRVHSPIKTPDYYDEVIVFLGASYFRAVGTRPGLRPLGARPRHRHRAAVGRGVPVLQRVLAGRRPAPDATSLDALRAARQPER